MPLAQFVTLAATFSSGEPMEVLDTVLLLQAEGTLVVEKLRGTRHVGLPAKPKRGRPAGSAGLACVLKLLERATARGQPAASGEVLSCWDGLSKASTIISMLNKHLTAVGDARRAVHTRSYSLRGSAGEGYFLRPSAK